MNEVIASCMICGQMKKLAVWVDPGLTGGSYHGVCIECRDKANMVATMNDADLENRFTYHAPMPNQIGKFENIRKNARWMVTLFTQMCPKSRELSLAITKIEEAVFWANAAIARNEKE